MLWNENPSGILIIINHARLQEQIALGNLRFLYRTYLLVIPYGWHAEPELLAKNGGGGDEGSGSSRRFFTLA